MTLTYIFLAAILGVCVIGLWMNRYKGASGDAGTLEENAELKAEVKQLTQNAGKLQKDVEHVRDEKNELVGKNKALFVQHEALKTELKHLTQERDALKKSVTEFETDERRRAKEIELQTTQLSNAQKRFEDEQKRVIREDEERMQHVEQERDRVWAEHENSVISQLTLLCKSPQLAFAHYTNTNLPDDFDGSLKPDFMIKFLDQYIIFDAKKSKQESLQTYMNNAIKSTINKVKKNSKIASMIYLVVPTEALAELKSFVYPVDGYTIYVVAPEALPPILASLKKITTYEFAEQMDPQQRENMIQLVAELDFHINLRNAADLIMTKMGTDLLEKAQKVDPVLTEEVALKKAPMNAKASLAAGELKRIVSKLTTQVEEAQQLVSPKTPIRKKDLLVAESLLSDTLL